MESSSIYRKCLVLWVILLLLGPFCVYGQSSGSRWYKRGLESESSKKIEELDSLSASQISIPVLLGVELSNLTQNFGDPRSGGTRTHEGLDIMAPLGDPVVSPTDAVVTSTGNGVSAGLYVRTANPGGETFVYMHLSKIADGIERGKILARGDTIGFVGNTGNASGGATHLHFEIRKDGATDPFPRLTSTFTEEERVKFNTTGFSLNGGGSSSQKINETENPTTGFSRDLTLGATGDDVRALQVFLNSEGFTVATSGVGSAGKESNYFGTLTKAALARFQASHGISPSVGYFGPLTRKFISA